MINIKKIIKQGLNLRDKGFEELGNTIQKAAEKVGLGRDDEEYQSYIPKDVGKDPKLNKEFLAVFKAQNLDAKEARIVVNTIKWLEEYQFDRLIEKNRQAIAVYKEDGVPYIEYLTFTQQWTSNGWGKSLLRFSTSKNKLDPSIF
ncbi:hypothetical protein [Polaribacter aestuariivivens]|uniref:hypothetical protein n=1 Tax=Polaribacter aestuariivivens TaxID=2304626 RepID=UPI003F497155